MSPYIKLLLLATEERTKINPNDLDLVVFYRPEDN